MNYTISGGTLSLHSSLAGAYLSIGRNQVANTSTLTVQVGGTVNIGPAASQHGQLNINGNDGNSNAKLDVRGGMQTEVGTSMVTHTRGRESS